MSRGLSPSAGVGTLCEHMFDEVEEVPNPMDIPKDLTKRQQEIFDFIKRYSASHGYPPTVRDIGKAVGLASSSTVHAHLANLEKVGLLRRGPSEPPGGGVVGRAGSAAASAPPAGEAAGLPTPRP